jgi:hypothetical protein
MKDQQVAEIAPAFAWKECHEITLHFAGVSVLRKSKAFGKAANMSVYHHASLNPKAIAEHHIGGLTRHATQG